MEKKSKMAKVYGYLVCLVAVITVIICMAGLINAIMDLQDPLHSGYSQPTPSLASFNNYKMDILKAPEKSTAAYTPDDATLREMFEAAKADKIQKVNHDSMQAIVVNSVLIIICALLFTMHWIWMRRLEKADSTV